jgi:hypothetical protein
MNDMDGMQVEDGNAEMLIRESILDPIQKTSAKAGLKVQ